MSADDRLIKPEHCDVCGRGMLRGETTRSYVTDRGERAGVCDLCKDRALAAGWVPADRATRLPTAPKRRPRRPAAVGLREMIGAAGARGAERRSGRASGGKTSEGAPVGISRDRRVRDALAAFNTSDHPRTIAGLGRSLGKPRASAVPVGRDGAVRVTVAWDLAWYQWQTNPEPDGDIRVREYKKGSELGQLSPHDRAWNVRVGEDGSLRIAPPGERGGDEDDGE